MRQWHWKPVTVMGAEESVIMTSLKMVAALMFFVFIWLTRITQSKWLLTLHNKFVKFCSTAEDKCEHQQTVCQSSHINYSPNNSYFMDFFKNHLVLSIVETGEILRTLWNADYDRFLIIWAFLYIWHMLHIYVSCVGKMTCFFAYRAGKRYPITNHTFLTNLCFSECLAIPAAAAPSVLLTSNFHVSTCHFQSSEDSLWG